MSDCASRRLTLLSNQQLFQFTHLGVAANKPFTGSDRNSTGVDNMASKAFAVVAGAGTGTGASVARRFARSYPVILLARSAGSYESLVSEINGSGGKAIGILTDLSNEESVKAAFKKIGEEHPECSCAAAIYNASGGFARKPFLEMKMEEFDKSWNVTLYDHSTILSHWV